MHPILFRIPYLDLPIFSYGFMIMMGFLVAIAYASRRGKKDGFDPNHILDLGVLMVITGVIGARVFFYVQYYHHPDVRFDEKPWYAIFEIWQGGIVFYGGLIFATLAGVIFMRMRKMPVLETTDLLAPGVPLGLAFGRIGCFLNGCCWGKVCGAAWYAITFPRITNEAGEVTGSPAYLQHCESDWADSVHLTPLSPAESVSYPVYPVQLIGCAKALLIALILMWAYRHRRRAGQIFGLLWIIYPIGRFLLEFLRGDTSQDPVHLFGLTVTISQAVGILALPFGVVFFAAASLYGKPVNQRASEMVPAGGGNLEKTP